MTDPTCSLVGLAMALTATDVLSKAIGYVWQQSINACTVTCVR